MSKHKNRHQITVPRKEQPELRIPPPPQQTQTFSAYTGPLPHPEMLEKYNAVVPGAAERIIAAFENQNTHRQALENHVIHSDVRRSDAGLASAIGITLAALIAACYLISTGHDFAGVGIFGVSLAQIVVAFINGGGRQPAEPKQASSK